MVTLYSFPFHPMRLPWSFFRPTFPTRLLSGFWLSLLATLALISAPAHSLMSVQQAHAVTLCTAQGMMTVWTDDSSEHISDDFGTLKLKASQQCLGCLAHLPNLAPPTQAPALHVAHIAYQLPAAHDLGRVGVSQWRWVSPRAPPV